MPFYCQLLLHCGDILHSDFPFTGLWTCELLLPVFSFINNAILNICVQVCVDIRFHRYLGLEFLGHMENVCLTF